MLCHKRRGLGVESSLTERQGSADMGRDRRLHFRWAGKAALRRWYASRDLKEVRRQVRDQRTRPRELQVQRSQGGGGVVEGTARGLGRVIEGRRRQETSLD